MQAICNWAFEEDNFELVEAKAYIQNKRSWGVLENLGYKYEGIQENEIEGKLIKWKVYTLSKDLWKKLDWPKNSFFCLYSVP